jgi:hypothetical protein
MNTKSAHVSLDDLIDSMSGAGGDPAAQAHLLTCTTCQAEARRWSAVASRVHRMWSSAEPPPWDPDMLTTAASARPAPGYRVLSLMVKPARRRRAWAVSAAALILLGGMAYGVADVTGGTGSARPAAVASPGTGGAAAGLTAVTGCAGLKAAVGTLVRVSGSGLTLRTSSGHLATVTASASVKVTRLVNGPVSDLTNGERVVISGTDDNGTLDATAVSVLPGSVRGLPTGPSGMSLGEVLLRQGHALGTVADLTGSGFTVKESDGTTVPVKATSATLVLRVVSSSVSQLKSEGQTVAVGTVGSGGVLSADAVEQTEVPVSQILRQIFPGGPDLPLPSGSSGPWTSPGCSPSSAAAAALMSAT